MRNTTIDIAKGIGILTVVLCHNWILYHDRGELSRVVFSFHMPLFFFISGLFFKPNIKFIELLISKADALLKPFFMVLIAVLIIFDLRHNTLSHHKAELLSIAYASGNTINWTPLWYLSHLFVVFVFSWVFYKYILSKVDSTTLKGLVLLSIYYFGTQHIDYFKHLDIYSIDNIKLIYRIENSTGLPFNLDIILVTMPIFLTGYLLKTYIENFSLNWSHALLAAFVFIGLHYFFNDTIELNGRSYDNFLICTLQIISGIYLVFALASLASRIPYLSTSLAYLGFTSLYILIFHFSFQHIFTGVFQYHFPQYKFLIALLGMILSIIFSVVLWEMTMKFDCIQKLMLPLKRKK